MFHVPSMFHNNNNATYNNHRHNTHCSHNHITRTRLQFNFHRYTIVIFLIFITVTQCKYNILHFLRSKIQFLFSKSRTTISGLKMV